MTIERNHSKPKEDVRQSVNNIADDLSNDLGITHSWEGDTLKFSRTGVNGKIDVYDDEVVVTVNKSFFIPLSNSFIESKIEEYFDKYLD